jgi:type VI protein secretion system component VasF
VELAHVSHQITNSGLMRGKRLKRLLQQLSGRQAMSDLYRLKVHIWIVLGAVVLLHVGCFATCMVVVHKQEVYVGAVSNAGEQFKKMIQNIR